MRPWRRHAGSLLVVVAFFLAASLPLAGLLLGFENPSLEKRSLSPLPELLTDGKPNLRLTREFEDYYADHFAFRSYLVTAYHRLNQALLGQSGSGKVLSGRDGWLFFGETLPDFLAEPVLTDAGLRRLALVLSLQKEYLDSLGIEFLFAVAPNKNSLYGDRMPDRYRPVRPMNSLALWLASPLSAAAGDVDLLTPLREAVAGSDTPLYHRTDSHWNNLGARVAYQVLMAAAAETAPEDFAYDDYSGVAYETRTDWEGDLAVMLSPSGVEPEDQQYFDIPQAYRTLRPMRSLEDLRIDTRRLRPLGDGKGLDLLMFRDSFANALIPLLANQFDTATFSREVPYDYRDIDPDTLDLVLVEIVERNLSDLLDRAPVLPAPWRTLPEGADGAAARDLRLEALSVTVSDGWRKVTGRIGGDPETLDTVGRILIGLSDAAGVIRYVEAFPIDETGDAAGPAGPAGKTPGEAAGLTAWLPAEDAANLRIVRILYEMGDAWGSLEADLVLP